MAHLIYELSFKGSASDAVRAAFDDLEVRSAHGITIVRGQFRDQASLHGAFARIQGLGLELLDVHLVADAQAQDLPQWDEADDP